jgi:hypothetical protein
MKITRRIGLGLLIIAATLFGSWTLWANTRKWCPANVLLSLAKGSHTQTNEFQINVAGRYEIAVEVDRDNSSDLNALTCALGTGATWPERTCSSPSVLGMSWTLMSGDKVASNGSTDEMLGGSTSHNSAARTLGYFQARRGQQYRLIAEAVSDGSSLAAANPRLKVNMNASFYEFILVVGEFIKWGSGIMGAIGLILVLTSILKRESGATGSSAETKASSVV